MKKFNFEYNESVQGFVVSCGKEEANMQFCPLNNEMLFDVDGGYSSDGFNDEMKEKAYNEAQNNEQVLLVEHYFQEIYSDRKSRAVFEERAARQGYMTLLDISTIAQGQYE